MTHITSFFAYSFLLSCQLPIIYKYLLIYFAICTAYQTNCIQDSHCKHIYINYMNKHKHQISTWLIQMISLPYTVMASLKKNYTNLKSRKDTWHANRSLFLHIASDFPYRTNCYFHLLMLQFYSSLLDSKFH